MRIHDVVTNIERMARDAQNAVAKTPRIDANDLRFTQLRIELDAVWNAVYVIARELDRQADRDTTHERE